MRVHFEQTTKEQVSFGLLSPLFTYFISAIFLIITIACDDTQRNHSLNLEEIETEVPLELKSSMVTELAHLELAEQGPAKKMNRGADSHQKNIGTSSLIRPLRLTPNEIPWRLSVHIQYHDRIYSADGYDGSHMIRTVPNLRAELIKEVSRANGDVERTTLDQGYSDDHGYIMFRWRSPSPEHASFHEKTIIDQQFYIYVWTSQRTEYGDKAEVRSREGNALYQLEATLPLEVFVRSEKGEPWLSGPMVKAPMVTLTAMEEGALSGAFNILNATKVGFNLIHQHSEDLGPKLTFLWDIDQAVSCGSCYVGDMVRLGGQIEDPDHYDDHIILHEMGHFFTHRWSIDDSPGGPHRGRAVHPSLAYGEGIAYFWSALSLKDPLIVDWMFPEPWVVDLERSTFNGDPMTWGLFAPVAAQSELTHLSALHHEELVSSLMWSFYQFSQEQDIVSDELTGEELIMSTLLHQMPARHEAEIDIGAFGVDLADYLDSLICEIGLGVPSRFDVWLNQAERLAEERGYEWQWDTQRESGCSHKSNGDRLVIHMATKHKKHTLEIDEVSGDFVRLNDQSFDWKVWMGTPPATVLIGSGSCLQLPCILNPTTLTVALNDKQAQPLIVQAHWQREDSPTTMVGSWRSEALIKTRQAQIEYTKYRQRLVLRESAIVSY